MLGQIFKAYDVRATYPDKLNEAAAWKIGVAAGRHLSRQAHESHTLGEKEARTILVSRDMRPSSPSLAAALIEGLRAADVDVIDLGMCDTPFMYFAINHLGAAGGIQTTASHNPANYNGFKVSGVQAKPVGADTGLKTIQALAETLGDRGSLPLKGTLESRDIWNEYREHVLKFLQRGEGFRVQGSGKDPAVRDSSSSLNPEPRTLKVFIDASNGMAGKLVPKVFSGVKNLQITPLNFEITGSFVHEPNPLVAENMVPTQAGTRSNKADMGVCFDGDADRCILTDEKGNIIGCDHLTALLAGYFLKQSPGSAIVYDLRSSKVVEETVRALGGVPHRCRVGHVFMKADLRKTRGVFGGELSGHFYFQDNFYADSGAITFAAVLSVLGQGKQTLSELIAPFQKYPQSGERNFRVEDKAGVMAKLKMKYAGVGSIDELDGVSVDSWDKNGWWFNVRASNTEPLLRFNAEAKDRATLERLYEEVLPMLGEPDTGGH